MDIDLRNYQKKRPSIQEDITNSSFISFDFEFTGLTTIPQGRENEFQDEEEHYQRIRQICCNFGLLQLGLTCFIYKEGRYHPHCYNIYVRNPPKGKDMTNLMVVDVDSMDFLCNNNMDFSRVFKYGITSRRLGEKDKLVEEIKRRFTEKKEHEIQILGHEDEKILHSIEQRLVDEVEKEKKEVVIDFHKKILLNFLKKKYNFVFCERKNKEDFKELEFPVKAGKGFFLIPSYEVSEEGVVDQAWLEEQVHEEMGLSSLVETIINRRVPIVGHYLRLDIGFLYHYFIHQLPESVAEFEAGVTKHFPLMFDTKVISKVVQKDLKALRMGLESLGSACSQPHLLGNYNNVIEGRDTKYDYVSCCHEAGYDSYLTGVAFVGMLNYIYHKDTPQKDSLSGQQKQKPNKNTNL